jgi:hypothetical protein
VFDSYYAIVEIFQSVGVMLYVEQNIFRVLFSLEDLVGEIFLLGVAEDTRNQIFIVLTRDIFEAI